MAFAFGVGNGIAVRSLTYHHQINSSQHQHPVHQCLLYDFHCIFTKGRSIAQNVHGVTIRLEGAAMLSKRYRSAIKRAIKMLEQAEYTEGQSQESVQHLGEELCSVELLWSLVEAASIRPSHNLIVIDLLEWARECFPSAQSIIPSAQEGRMGETSFLGSIMEDLVQQERPETHESYWNAVIRQALCADFPSVSTLLQFHSEYKNDETLAKMVRILNAANAALFMHDRSSCEEFLAVQKKVRDLITQKHLFRLHDNLGVICSLLIGDRGTFKKYFDLFRPNWFEVLPAFMLYFYPGIGGEQTPKVIENFFSLLGIRRHQLPQMEQTILSILELDLIAALKLICSGGQSAFWFATHLVDLLHFHDPNFINPSHAEKPLFGEPVRELAELDLRSRLLIEYTQLLFQNDQLWEIAPDYICASEYENANQTLDQIVAQLNFHGNVKMAERLLTLCDRHELWAAKEDILRALALKFCRQNDLSCALGWALRMQNNELTVRVARRILQGGISADQIGQMRVFESLAEQFVDCSELVLLYKFYTFKRHLSEAELRQAVLLLYELFVDNSSPTEFHIVLFEEMVRILAIFQQPLVGLDALDLDQTNAIPGLDRESVQDMFRAMSMFQLQRAMLKTAQASAAHDGRRNEHEGTNSGRRRSTAAALFPPSSKTLSTAELNQKIDDLMNTLRPMLAQALAACSLQ